MARNRKEAQMEPYMEHEKLKAYQLGKQLLRELHGLTAGLPRSEREMADQISRAASSVLLNTAEGAGRRTRGDKARFYDIARGSAAECGAAVDVLAIRGFI